MDSHLFHHLVPTGEYVEEGPQAVDRLQWLLALSLWLNEAHEDHPPVAFPDYLRVRGWDEQKLLTGQWRLAHAQNAEIASEEEIQLKCMAIIQSWVTFVFLEGILCRWVTVEELTRDIRDHPVPKGVADKFPAFKRVLEDSPVRYFHTKYLLRDLAIFGLRLIAYDPTEIRTLFGLNADVEPLPSDELEATKTRLKATMKTMSDVLYALGLLEMTTNTFTSENADLFRFLLGFPVLLAETTKRALMASLGTLGGVEAPYCLTIVQKHDLVNERNWCPFTLQRALDCTDYSVFYWIWATGLRGLSHEVSLEM